jgi:hypothetical protein
MESKLLLMPVYPPARSVRQTPMPLPFHAVVSGGCLVRVWIQGAPEPLLLAMFGVVLFSAGVLIRRLDTKNSSFRDSTIERRVEESETRSDEAAAGLVSPVPTRTMQPQVSYAVMTQFHLPLSEGQDSTSGSVEAV